MERAIARASQAYKANEVALDDGRDLATTEEDPAVDGVTNNAVPAHVDPTSKSGRNLNHIRTAKNLRTAAAVTVNLRDCGAISRILRPGRMFRSSQVMRYEALYAVSRTVLLGPGVLPWHTLNLFLCLCSAAEIDRLGVRVRTSTVQL